MTTTNEHTERAELIRIGMDAGMTLMPRLKGETLFTFTGETLDRFAAALLEAQLPALKPLTDEQINDISAAAYCGHDREVETFPQAFARAIIAEFCRINGITGEAQPAEQAKGREAAAWMDECLVAIHAAACTLGNFGSYFFGSSRQVGLRQDQVEQYQEMHRKAEEGVNALMDLHDQLRGFQPDHITPPAQPAREWVGLTEIEQEAIEAIHKPRNGPQSMLNYTRAIESKLREKNAGQPATDDKAGGEPVAEIVEDEFSRQVKGVGQWHKLPNGTKLYTHPQPKAQAEPEVVALYEDAMIASNEAGYVGFDAASTIRAMNEAIAKKDAEIAAKERECQLLGSAVDKTRIFWKEEVHGLRAELDKAHAALDACVDALHKSKQNTLASAQGFYEDYGTTKQTLDDFQDKQLIAEIDAAITQAEEARK